MKPRVFVTGLGTINGAGMTFDETWDSIKSGRTGIAPLEGDTFQNCPYQLGAQVKTYRPRELVSDKKLLKLLSRHDVYGLNAARQALEHSGVLDYRDTLENPSVYNDRFGVYVGSPGNKYYQQYDFMPLLAEAKGDMKAFAAHLFEKVHPMWLLKILPNNVLAYTGIQYQLKGPNENITNHVAGGLQALAEAHEAIISGEADRAVVVSYDIAFEVQQLNYFGRLGILTDTALIPFDKAHSGTVMAEGAAALVIENEESVKARGVTPYAEIISSASSTDAHGIFSIEEDGEQLQNAVSLALEKANISNDDIGMLTAHGNGNQRSDETEALAYTRCFGELPPMTGFKWSTGHLLCASALLDTILTCQSMKENVVPGIAPFKTLADSCEGLTVSQDHQAMTGSHAMVVSRGFGGINTALILKKMGV